MVALPPLPGIGGDETVFADGKVNHIGQIIGIIVAESQPIAQRAVKTVQVTYEDLPSIITIDVSRLSSPQCYKFIILNTCTHRMPLRPTPFIPLNVR